MEWMGALGLSVLLGFRHGLDPDHMAAITDMVGSNTKARRSVLLGIMYALGHGLVVLLIGVAAILLGRSLPEGFLRVTEMLVGVSLVVLGGVILRSLFAKGSGYEYRSRWEIVVSFWRNLYARLTGRSLQERALGTFHVGLLGAMCIGIVHGIGAETPTQLTIIGHSSMLGNTLMSVGILAMFVVGLLMSTSAVSLISAWGFMKARSVRSINLAMGLLAGGYSLFLGVQIMLNA
jgi:high-affinity nickel permease